jgi:hypothetical protein
MDQNVYKQFLIVALIAVFFLQFVPPAFLDIFLATILVQNNPLNVQLLTPLENVFNASLDLQ